MCQSMKDFNLATKMFQEVLIIIYYYYYHLQFYQRPPVNEHLPFCQVLELVFVALENFLEYF